MKAVTGSEILETARSYIGTPFHHQGRKKGVGVDCAGLLVLTAEELGVSTGEASPRNYSRFPLVGRKFYEEVCLRMLEIPVSEIVPGSAVMFWIRRPDKPQHIGLWTGAGLLHAWFEAGKVLECSYGPYWKEREYAAFNFRGFSQ